jgi:plastocyanin
MLVMGRRDNSELEVSMRGISGFAGLAMAALVGCSSGSDPNNGGNGNGNGNGNGSGDPPDAAVAVANNVFSPSTVNITTGQTVRWTWNSGGVNHNVTFGVDPSSTTKGSGTFDRTFDAAGTFAYHCTIHVAEGMAGSVVVADAP